MSWITYNYKCENDQCAEYEKVDERLIKRDERDDQRCGVCGITMKRMVSAPKEKHISWSTWRV